MRRGDDVTTSLERGSTPGAGGSDDSTIVDLPPLASTGLLELLEAAAAPAQAHELSWELGARTVFRAETARWPRVRHRRARRAVVATTIAATVLAGSTGLAAATGFPAPAARIVDHMFDDQSAAVAPSGAVTTPANPASGPRRRAAAPAPASVLPTPSTHHIVTPPCSIRVTGSAEGRSSGSSTAMSCRSTSVADPRPATGELPTRTGRGGAAPVGSPTPATSGEAPVTGVTPPPTGVTNPTPPPTSPSSTTTTSTTTTTPSRGPGTGTGRGGNQGTGSGTGKKGTGGTKGAGGKKGTGQGGRQGTGRGGNQGAGSGRGGSPGTGTNRGGVKGSAPGTGANRGRGSGATTIRGGQSPAAGRAPG